MTHHGSLWLASHGLILVVHRIHDAIRQLALDVRYPLIVA